LEVTKTGSAFQFELTPQGRRLADSLKEKDAFKPLANQMKVVKQELGTKSGSVLKKLIYQVFAKEVADKTRGEVIT